jgi:hypothetical protein
MTLRLDWPYASQSSSDVPYEQFNVQFEAQAIQDVMGKRAKPPTTDAAATQPRLP